MLNRTKTIKSIEVDILTEAVIRSWEHKKDDILTLHEFAGLITEEVMELMQAINETSPTTKTDKAVLYGGYKNIYQEGVQVAALITRLLYQLKERFDKNGDDE